jgi:septation ring formation regulator EzrA
MHAHTRAAVPRAFVLSARPTSARARREQELKHRKSGAKRKQEVYEEEEEATVRQRAAILADLRAQAERVEAELEAERARYRSISSEIAELRGRLAHAAKEQAQWETDLKVAEQKVTSAATIELQRLRLLKPAAAARIREERSAGTLQLEGGGERRLLDSS